MPRISRRRQVTIPTAVLRDAGLQSGDQMDVEVVGAGELRLRRTDLAFERAFGVLTGTYARGGLERLDREDEDR